MSSSGPVNNTAPSRSVPSGRIVTSSSNYRPPTLCWCIDVSAGGSGRAERPVL